ncbi:Dabb family protein [Parasediminibacterium sp. JCM 36343]|uniref:Dabb family protein n=1 Tax=Parasediminibacterium sp. JCM 36343 TaxID=3374279 RepID=UPI00397CE811
MSALSRRKFLAAASLAAIATTASGLSKRAAAKQSLMHIVYYWLKNPASEADKQKLIDGLHELVTVKQIKYHHIGVPQVFVEGDPQKSYHVSLLMVFEEAGDIDVYHKDPIHAKFVKECGDLWGKIVKADSLAV